MHQMFESTESSKASQYRHPIKLQSRAPVVAQQAPELYRRQSTEEPLDAKEKSSSLYITDNHSTAGQSSLPLQWIDEQELRQNKTGLRKTVRSYARRDTCLRQQRKNAASRPNPKALRNIVEKSGSDIQVPSEDRSSRVQSRHDRTSKTQQIPKLEKDPLEQCRVPRTTTIERNKSKSCLALAAGIDGSDRELVVMAGKDQCKSSLPRHCIRSVPMCKSRSRRCISLPDPSTHEAPTNASSASTPQNCLNHQSDACVAESSYISSLNAKNILLSGSWREDPFDVYGKIVNNPRVALLLNHHQEAIGSTWRPHVNRSFLDWNLSSEVLLHGLLYFAASHLYGLTNCITVRHDILHHKGEVLRLINQYLGDPGKRTSDTTIGALSYLIIFEEMYGSKETAAFHRDGLRKILNLRKELPGPGLNYFLIKMLPITGVEYIPQAGLSPVINRTSHPTIQRSEEETLVKITIPENAMHEIFTWLRNSARLVSNLAPDAPNRKKESYLVRTKIQSYLYHLDLNPNFENRDVIRSWMTASLIYIHIITATKAEFDMLHISEFGLVKQLRSAIQDVIASPSGVDWSCDALLWCLLLGRLPARYADAVWFHDAIVTSCNTAKIESWFETKELLKGFPWVEINVEERIRAFCPFDEKC